MEIFAGHCHRYIYYTGSKKDDMHPPGWLSLNWETGIKYDVDISQKKPCTLMMERLEGIYLCLVILTGICNLFLSYRTRQSIRAFSTQLTHGIIIFPTYYRHYRPSCTNPDHLARLPTKSSLLPLRTIFATPKCPLPNFDILSSTSSVPSHNV